MKTIPITQSALLEPVKSSKVYKNWLASHATEVKAADEQRRRAGAFQAIAGQARAVLADRATADPQMLIRASGDLHAAERERDACIAEAEEIERQAILAGQHGEATVKLAADELMKANSEQAATLASELAELAKRHGVELTEPDAMQLPPMRVYDLFRMGTIDDRITALWFMLQ